MGLTTRRRLLPAAAGMILSSTVLAQAVRTESGLVEGVEEVGVLVFKGIPFAAPPIGERRWRPPAPPTPWSGVMRADRFSPICVQRGAYPDDAPPEPMSEDCLYLNIWTPARSGRAPLPVMVWIYGGGFQNGSGSTPLYAGDRLAGHDVIVVTFNYRLGAFGFLAHPGLSRESDRAVSGNYGLLDQVAALGWVRRNIAAFGGDPANVTVFGQSSGSIAISVLMASPIARGLFRRAIGQSGGLLEPVEVAPEFSLQGAERIGVAFATRLGAATPSALRSVAAEQIVAQRFSPHPVIDGQLLTDTPYRAHASRRINEVDLLVGSNDGEGWYFLGDRVITAANLGAELKRHFPGPIVSLLGPKSPADDRSALAAFVGFEGRIRFGWNMWAWARLHAARGRGRTFGYRFTHRPPGEAGATHGAELAYLFGHPTAGWTADDVRLSESMATYWTSFAKTGDPNGDGLPEWPPFGGSDRRVMLLGKPLAAGVVPDERSLAAIDRTYWAVRVVTRWGWWIAAAVVLAALAVLVRAVRRCRLR